MKYETPICELVKISAIDIISTSGADDNDQNNDDAPLIGGSGFLK